MNLFSIIQKRPSNRFLLALAGFVAGFQVTAQAPASLAVSLLGGSDRLTVAKTEGTLWSGVLVDARAGGVALGDVSFSLRGLSLLTGAASADVRLEGGAVFGSGRVRASFGGIEISDAQFDFDLATARRYMFLGAPLEGRLSGVVRELKLAPKGCAAADIDLRTNVLAAPARRFRGAPLDLAGGASCVNGAIIATLAGESVDGAVRLRLAVRPDMTYTLDATAAPARAELAEALRVFGFTQGEGAMSMAMSGAFRPGS
ncbi:MAG: type II secretion system protein N [Parvularculaceae bacterium]|nr:type II secretion system protein N [Parvularculaceae bacterium]